MQAQVPMDPYTGLWARIDNFRPEKLGRLIEEREAVRMPLMRTTVHLVSAPDALMLRPLFQPVLTRTLRSTQFGKDVAGMEMEPLLTAALALVEERPRTKRELRQLLGPLWPDRNANSMVQAVHYLMPLVQVPPRGVWGARGSISLRPRRSPAACLGQRGILRHGADRWTRRRNLEPAAKRGDCRPSDRAFRQALPGATRRVGGGGGKPHGLLCCRCRRSGDQGGPNSPAMIPVMTQVARTFT